MAPADKPAVSPTRDDRSLRRLLAWLTLLLTLVASLSFRGPARAADGDGAGASGEAEAVTCANLIYAGTRSSVCFSDKFLSIAARDTRISTARKFKPVKVGTTESIFSF